MTSRRQTRLGFLRTVGLATGVGLLALGGFGPLVAETSQTLPFYATIYVQGAANWIPHTDGSKVLVMFPDSEVATNELKLTTALHGEPLCHHYAVVQSDARNLGLPIDAWIGFDVTGNWLKFDAQGADPLVAGNLPGLAPLEAVLKSVGKTFSPWDGSTQRARAALVLDQGRVEPDGEYLEEYTFSAGDPPITGQYSNVHRVELGLVTGLSLRMRQFGTQEDQVLEFTAPPSDSDGPGEVEVWMRHFCRLDKPLSPPPAEIGPALDPEFTLNWAFQSQSVIQVAAELPFPLAPDTGGETRHCMGTQDPPLAFQDPFE